MARRADLSVIDAIFGTVIERMSEWVIESPATRIQAEPPIHPEPTP